MESEDKNTNPLVPIQPSKVYTKPVTGSHDYRLRWNEKAIQFETPTGMKHLDWKDVVHATSSEPMDGFDGVGKTLDLTDRGGVVHKIPFADIPTHTRWLDLLDTVRFCSEARLNDLTPELYNLSREFVVHLWAYGQSDGENEKKTRRWVSAVIIVFALGWIFELLATMGSGNLLSHSVFPFFQFIKFLPLMFIPLYARAAPVSQIRCTPGELRCEAVVGGHIVVKRRLSWIDMDRIVVGPEAHSQRLLDRELCFYKKGKEAYRLKLDQIGTADNWRELLSSIFHSSGKAVEGGDPHLFDRINPDQKDPSYTQIWLDSLLAPAHREKLLQLESGAALQNGKYVLENKLGAGGQGAAYLARRADGTKVVLKEYILPIYVDAKVKRKSLENFENEARMLEQLDSQLIVKLLGFFVEDHRGYLVLEHISGMNLRDYVLQNGVLQEKRVVHFGTLMCDALIQLHSLTPPIVHRDFTPDNIIMSTGTDGAESIKIIDFMVAQQNEESATGTVVGKHSYLPPEQFRGKATPQSDIYALGCSLYFLLTGKEPEPLTTSHPILINDTVSGALDEIVAKATELECEDRYKSAQELRTALMNVST
ncbi:MAG TPA: serine/threonine-protein kinase [Drouetiella sp.]|jgi:tRNA A-37 threonylcarbamoyl transferase component Bud32